MTGSEKQAALPPRAISCADHAWGLVDGNLNDAVLSDAGEKGDPCHSPRLLTVAALRLIGDSLRSCRGRACRAAGAAGARFGLTRLLVVRLWRRPLRGHVIGVPLVPTGLQLGDFVG